MGETKAWPEKIEKLGQGNEWLIRLVDPDLERARNLLGKGILPDKLGVLSDSSPMRVVEMTGEPGDIIIWDPRSIHSSSGNVSDRPRSVVRFRFERAQSPRLVDRSLGNK